jgi:hypothetical protein
MGDQRHVVGQWGNMGHMSNVGSGVWGNVSVVVSVASVSLSVSHGVGVFASGYLGGVEWHTVGSDDWEVLGSVVESVGVGEWGGDNSVGGVGQRGGVVDVVSAAGGSFMVGGSMVDLGGNDLWGFQWDTVGSDDWDVLWVGVSVGQWSGDDSATLAVMVHVVTGSDISEGGQVGGLGVGYLGGVQLETVVVQHWVCVCVGVVSGVGEWSSVDQRSHGVSQWSNSVGVDSRVSGAGVGFSVGGEVGSLGVSYLGGVDLETVMVQHWDVCGLVSQMGVAVDGLAYVPSRCDGQKASCDNQALHC